MQKKRALTSRRIARSLVTVSLLTLIQTLAPPVLAPKITTPQSQAVTGTFTATSSTSRSYITIPAGVESITLTITGGGGGQGGSDVNAGGKGGKAQRIVATYSVSPGDVVALFPGNAGSNGTSSAGIDTGGTGVGGIAAGGASTVTDSYWNVNGTSYQNPSFSGGASGKVGALGTSGSGGGGGAASVVAINRNIVAIAGGAGGGGGAGSASGAGGTDGVDANTPNSNLMYGGAGKNSGAGLNCSASDGGSGGGGGGGYLAGTGGSTELVGNECSGRGGYRGNALVYAALSATTTSFDTSATPGSPLAGTIAYSYDVKSPSICTPSTTTVDIYTVLKFDASVNCTWTVPSTVSVIDIFAVGGGGGGGDDGGTGGGGGAGLSRSAVPIAANSSVTIRVGFGGRGGLFNSWDSNYGETSTVTTSTGAIFNAPGGAGGGNRATGKGAGGSAIANGTFAGGAGGAYPVQGAIGGAGNYGISNYFFGSPNTYGGGGGGGCYFDTYSNVSGAIGRNGGGAGCSNTSASGQVDATNGTAGTGGGGGGGGAGPAGRVLSGKGGSGVVLIRYATDAADAFPSSVSSSLTAKFSPGDMQVLDSTRKGWIDSSGGGASVANANFTGSPYLSTRGSTDGASQTDSSKTLLVAKGGTGDRITLRDLPTNYTLFSISRYVTSGTNGRLITASGGNWFSGHYNGTNGCAHHNSWLTGGGCNTTNLYGWQLNTDQLKYYRQNGVDVSMNQDAGYGSANYLYNQSTSTGFGINNDPYGQNSTWEVADVLVFNRQLTPGEIRAVENWLARVNGLTLNKNFQSSETDTAGLMDGSNYFYGQYLNGMYINDTFTVEGWVNPNAYCDGNTECPIFSYENVLVTRIYQGTFWYALYGSVSGWQWTDTKVKLQAGEWHHFALSKRLIGNQANAVDFYRDGKLVYVNPGTPYLNNAGNVSATNSTSDVVNTNDTWFYLGARSGTPRYYGQMDEIKVWKVARTGGEIASDLNSTDATNVNLQLYYDFNRDSLSDTYDLQNLAWGGHSRSDLVSAGTQTFQDVKIVSTTTPYTTIKFPRNYLTQTGGWKVPQGIAQVQVLLLGGGGGGGGGYEGGGGGAGGFIETLTTLNPGTTYSIQVGTGGRGALNPNPALSGETTNAFGFAAIGGGGGASEFNVSNVNVQYGPQTGGSGGGGSWSVNMTGAAGTTGQGSSGGSSSRLEVGNAACASNQYAGAGGGGAGGSGFSPTCTNGGNGGAGKTSTVLGAVVAGGGGGSSRNAAGIGYGSNNVAGSGGNSSTGSDAWIDYSTGAKSGVANTGGGGGAGISSTGVYGYGAYGGSGIVALRYITALQPTYTKPSNAYLNVGMTETFTTNIAIDSATVGLTRTFKWESSTPTSNGAFTTLKVGTGAANAAYSWVPSDTSTSGSGFLYRLTVTDSDTAGLFISDSSTAFAVINPTLLMSGPTSIKKTINIARNETFTISAGTPNYRYTLSPTIPGVTIDTSTVGITLLKISDTASVGSWIETLTVIDSVSASVIIPLTITISAPPTLLNTTEIVKNGLVFNLDAGNSASLLLDDQATATGYSWSDISGRKNNAVSGAGVNTGGYSSTGCTAPKYSSDNGGAVVFTGSTDNCLYSTFTGREFDKSYTFEAWFKTSATLPNWAAVVAQGYTSGTQPISVTIGSMGGSLMYVGFYDGGTWRYANCGYTPTIGAWTHIAGTYDGANLYTYINGSNIVNGSACSTALTSGYGATINPNGLIIGKGHMGGTGAYTFPGSIASVRLYNVPLTSTQILQNYNATKNRFSSDNLTLVKPSQKYGTLNLESFTVTSGGDTKTVTFAVGNRQGIQWDTTSIPGQVKLSVQESITPGTYYDTITVTDEFSASTTLPIKFTVTKADTLTVYVDTPTALSYTGSRAIYIPTIKTIGAVGLESGATLTSSISYKPSGTTCATGGYCRVGDVGPGGGIVFIDTSTASSDGRIYEVAPQSWSGSDDLSTVATYCSSNTLNLGATQVGIGWGETNTNLAKVACLGGAVARVNTYNLSNTSGYSDWFIPSKNEAIELAKIPATAGLLNIGNNWSTGKSGYWSSTESSTTVMWSIGHTGAIFNGSTTVLKSEASQNMVRPVRAFRSCWAIDTCTAFSTTDTPTAAGIYIITPSALTNSADLSTKYSAINYSPSRLTINRIAQRAQVIPFINTNYPETFTVNVAEGNGNGAVTFSAINGTASGCAFDYKKLFTTSQGICTVTVVKAGDRNYLPDTVTANVLFLAFSINQPSPAVGSGSTIALSGATSITFDPNAAPTISSLSTYTATAGSTQIVINGAGFNHLDVASISVKFWRNVTASGFTVNAGDSQITVTVPVGATTGKVMVTTPNGIAISELSLTITP